MIELEYDLILGEDDDSVLFLVNGREVQIPQARLVSYDYEGRFTLAQEHAIEYGLLPASVAP